MKDDMEFRALLDHIERVKENQMKTAGRIQQLKEELKEKFDCHTTKQARQKQNHIKKLLRKQKAEYLKRKEKLANDYTL